MVLSLFVFVGNGKVRLKVLVGHYILSTNCAPSPRLMLCAKRHISACTFEGSFTVFMSTLFLWKCFIPVLSNLFLPFPLSVGAGHPLLNRKKTPEGIVKVCGKIAGTLLYDLNELYRVRSRKKAQAILADPSHALWGEFMLLPSGRRYNLPQCRRNRFKRFFIPAAISLLNTL